MLGAVSLLRRVLGPNLREADWLTADRAQSYGRLIAVIGLLCALAVTWRVVDSTVADPQGRPVLTDFAAFWAAGDMVRHGHADDVYDVPAITAAERRAVQLHGTDYLSFLNPPVFLLLCALLAALPYLPAMAVFVLGSTAIHFACLRRIARLPWIFLPVLAVPGALVNMLIGQNGALTASCFGGGMLLLERRPLAAGACLGLLAYKPHLAAAVPVALLAARRWRALLACGTTAACLAALSWLVLGAGPWREFAHAPAVILAELAEQPAFWGKSVSIYGAIRVLAGGAGLAFAAQVGAAAAALAVLVWTVARRPGAGAEISAMVAATLLCSPHVMDYDLACLSVPLTWLAGMAHRTRWRPWEKTVSACTYMLPLAARFLSAHASLPVTPLVLAALLACVGMRARAGLPAWGTP